MQSSSTIGIHSGYSALTEALQIILHPERYCGYKGTGEISVWINRYLVGSVRVDFSAVALPYPHSTGDLSSQGASNMSSSSSHTSIFLKYTTQFTT